MKRILLLIMVALLPIIANAYDAKIDGIYYNLTNGQAWVTNGDKAYSGTVVIPTSVYHGGSRYSVTYIEDNAFEHCSGLTSIIIPNSVTSIGSKAFYFCSGLTSITIPNSVITIGNETFFCCYGLTSITIPNSVTWIGNEVFYNCLHLTSVTVGSGVTSIGNEAFDECSSLTSVELNCKSVKSWFSGLKSIKEIKLGDNVTSIGDYAFEGCSGLTDVFCYAEKVPSTGSWVFSYSPIAFATLHVPAGSVNLYKSTSPWREFRTIVPLENEIEDDTYIDGIYYNFSENDAEVTNGDITYSGAVVIPKYVAYKGNIYPVTSIGEEAFSGCINITSIKVPSTLKRIKSGAFKNCTSLSKIIVTDIASWCGIVYDGNSGSDFPMYYAKHLYSDDNTEITEVVIPEGVTRIESLAFRDAKYITSISIPNSVTYIGREAFRGTHSLTSIVFPQNISSIEPYTCQDCEALTFVDIPEGVTNIGDNAFAKCYDMKDFYCYAENVPTTGSNVFKSSTIASATLHVPKASVNMYKLASPWSGYGSIIPIEETPSSAIIFADANVKALCVANWDTNGDGELGEDEAAQIRSLGEVFYENKSIISFDELQYFTGLTNINGYAFHGCENLESIVIPNSVIRIDSHAFAHCCSLDSVDIPNSVTELGEAAFEACSGLITVTIPNSISSLSNYVFKWCSSLTSVSIPQNITSIGYEAFKFCNSLKDVFCYAENVPNTDNESFDKEYIASSTLHVPEGFIESYRTNSPWNGFGSIIKLNDYDVYISGSCYIFLGGNAEITYCNNTYSGAVVIPASVTYKDKTYPVTSIGEKAFAGCSNITAITIPASVTSVGDNTFKGCTSLKNVSMETNKPNKYSTRNNSDERWLDYVAISGTHGVNDSENYPNLFDNDISTKWCVDPVSEIVFIEFDATCPIKPTGYVLTTGNDTQYNPGRNPKSWIIKGRNETNDEWTTLTTVDDGNMPSESYAPKTFSLNTNTAYRYYRFEVTSLVSGTIFQLSEFCFLISNTNDDPIEEDTDVLVLGSNESNPLFADCPLDSVFIGRNISYPTSSDKGYSPFYRNASLRSVHISDVETEVSPNEFYGCTNLKNVRIGDGVTTIGDWAFSGCSSLDYFSFGSSVESIGKEAFSDCTAMTSLISKAETPPTCGTQALDDINKWECTLMVPDGFVEAYQAAPQWKEFFFIDIDPDGIKDIKDSNDFRDLCDFSGSWCSLDGKTLSKPQKGINIIRYSDGTTRKVAIK